MIGKSSNEPNRLMAASVGVAIPADLPMHWVISPNIILSERPTRKRENTQKISLPACWRPRWESTSIPSRIGTKRQQLFKMSGKIVRTTNMTQSTIGNKDGLWTTVFAAGVFINDETASLESEKVTTNDKASLQEEVLKQSLQGQPKDVGDKFTQRNINLPKADIVPAKLVQSPKKSFS